MQKNMPLVLSLFVTASAAIAACGSSQTPADSPSASAQKPKNQMMDHDAAEKCPMKVNGTTVRAEDAEGAATIVFSTTGDVVELRRRVAMMAKMHAKHQGKGHMAGMRKAEAGGHDHSKHRAASPDGAAMMKMPASSAASEQTETGARIVLTPKDPTDLEKLRAHALQMTKKMSSGDCQMMAPRPDDGGATHKHPGAN